MQKILLYLVPNRIRVTSDMTGFITEYRQVYQHKIKLYKGINNTVTFDVRNADQKKVDLRTYTPIVTAFDAEYKQILSVQGTVNPRTPSLFTVTFDSFELDDIQNQSLTLTAILQPVDSSNTDHLLYSDAQFGLGVTVEIENGVIPKPGTEVEIKTFQVSFGDKAFYSRVVPFGSKLNDLIDNAVSIAYYPGTFRGIITIEGTTNQSTAIGNTWDQIATNTITSSTPFTVDIVGKYTFIRFKFPEDSGMISKIVVKEKTIVKEYTLDGGQSATIFGDSE